MVYDAVSLDRNVSKLQTNLSPSLLSEFLLVVFIKILPTLLIIITYFVTPCGLVKLLQQHIASLAEAAGFFVKSQYAYTRLHGVTCSNVQPSWPCPVVTQTLHVPPCFVTLLSPDNNLLLSERVFGPLKGQSSSKSFHVNPVRSRVEPFRGP